ncbi:jg10352 [Pararge aegeria aegeria]|uniref:Jg10352 protein n=1 Tax=Pararge aegeria aegeria TaxID=348720 RepID=A0A8S4SLF8_9NEOP|nr:jg10352 [Pararge aegeria aegeria]
MSYRLPHISVTIIVFMQDNARPHTDRVTQAYLNDMNITVMEWPIKPTFVLRNCHHVLVGCDNLSCT